MRDEPNRDLPAGAPRDLKRGGESLDIVILDLEWNGTFSRRLKGYINEIIEFGAVKCGENLEQKSTFSCFVKPQVGKKISSTISSLTSITDENLTDGMTFMQAVSRFKKWAGDCVIMTWGTSDILTLTENCRYFNGDAEIPFLSHYCDLQVYAEHRMGLGTAEQVGLSRAAELLGLDVSGMEHHRALDDSLMTLEILRQLYDREELARFVSVCDEEFYRRVTFKTTYICDLRSPLVQRCHLKFSCPKCGGKSERKTRWTLKNKSFRAEFRCTVCGHPFAGRLLMKQKYEGLSVNKKTFPLAEIEKPRAAQPGALHEMRLEILDGVGVLKFAGLPETAARHAFSTRLGGVSGREFAAMNLGFGRGDSDENVAENYRLFCQAAGFDPAGLVAGAQDHHINIRRVGREEAGIGIWKPKEWESVDGLCTDEPGVTLVIYCADCVPLYFVDEEHHAIGLAHAGWRGTAMGMAKAMVGRMQAEFGTDPAKLRTAIGPSICKECFEVDEPVAAEFLKLPESEFFVSAPSAEPTPCTEFAPETGALPQCGGGESATPDAQPPRQAKYHVDLWECNRRFLLSAGVLPEHIAVGGVCTMCESDLIFSHRRTRGRRGSNCAFLALN